MQLYVMMIQKKIMNHPFEEKKYFGTIFFVIVRKAKRAIEPDEEVCLSKFWHVDELISLKLTLKMGVVVARELSN